MRTTVRGEVLAVGTGEVDIEDDLIRSRGVYHHPEQHIKVDLGPIEEGCYPCNPDGSDDDWLDWEVVVRPCHSHEHHSHHPHHDQKDILVLRIKWRVAYPRTVKWSITAP